MKLKNLNKDKYGKKWKMLFLELTNSKIYVINVSSIDFEKKFSYKSKEISFEKVITKEGFYYQIIVDNKKIDDKFYKFLEKNVSLREISFSKLGGILSIFWPFAIFVFFINIFEVFRNLLKKNKVK